MSLKQTEFVIMFESVSEIILVGEDLSRNYPSCLIMRNGSLCYNSDHELGSVKTNSEFKWIARCCVDEAI